MRTCGECGYTLPAHAPLCSVAVKAAEQDAVLKELAAIRGQLEVIAGALQAVTLMMPDGSAVVATLNQGIDEIPN